MPTIAAGASQNITLAAGQTLQFAVGGAGVAVATDGQHAGTTYQLGNQPFTLGPFRRQHVFSVSCSRAVTYTTGAGTDTLSPVLTDGTSTYDGRGQALGGFGSSSVPGVYLPKGWGDKWKAKLALAGAGQSLARIAWVGDSVLAGAWCSDLENKNLPGLINAQLQAKYGDGGSGYSSSWRTDLILANAGYTPLGRWTLAGTWAANPSVLDGPGGNHIRAGSANATATKVVRGTTVIVTLFSGNSASFGSYTVTIDGVVQGSAVSTNTGTQGIIRRTFTGLSAGNHTVVVTATDANGSTTYLFLCGIEAVNASGVVTHNYARGSYPSQVFNNVSGASYVYTDGSTFGGASVGSFGAAGHWSGGRKNPADLVVWGLGLNDSRFGLGGSTIVTPDAFASNLERFLAGVRDGDGTNYDSLNPDTEIMLMAPHAGSPTFQGGTVRYYANYCEQMRAMAEVYGCAFINVWQMAGNNYKAWLDAGYFGTNANGLGGAGTDAVHPSDAGFAQMAAMVSPYIVL